MEVIHGWIHGYVDGNRWIAMDWYLGRYVEMDSGSIDVHRFSSVPLKTARDNLIK